MPLFDVEESEIEADFINHFDLDKTESGINVCKNLIRSSEEKNIFLYSFIFYVFVIWTIGSSFPLAYFIYKDERLD